MNIAAVVMVLILVNFIFKTINRLNKKPVIHPSWITGLEMAIVIGAILWFLEFLHIITF